MHVMYTHTHTHHTENSPTVWFKETVTNYTVKK